MENTTSAVYRHVMDDVGTKTKYEFISFHGHDSTLQQLLMKWEMRMVNCGVFPCPSGSDPSRPKGETCSAGENSSAQAPLETQKLALPFAEGFLRSQQTGAAAQVENQNHPNRATQVKTSKRAFYMQQPNRPWLNQKLLSTEKSAASGTGQQNSKPNPPTKNFLMLPRRRQRRRTNLAPVVPDKESTRLQQRSSSSFTSNVQLEAFLEALKSNQKTNVTPGDSSNATTFNTKESTLSCPCPDGYHALFDNGGCNYGCDTPSRNAADFFSDQASPVTDVAGDDDVPFNKDDDDDNDDDDDHVQRFRRRRNDQHR